MRAVDDRSSLQLSARLALYWLLVAEVLSVPMFAGATLVVLAIPLVPARRGPAAEDLAEGKSPRASKITLADLPCTAMRVALTDAPATTCSGRTRAILRN
jgi:hypothetical protein